MAQLVVAAAGGVVGFFLGGPTGAAAGFALGYSVMAGKGNTSAGRSSPQDLRVTGVQYGQAIPWVLGAPRMAGQIWWASNKRAISHSQSAGKGGGQTSTSFTYEVDLLIGLTDGPIASVTRIWSNGKLIWTNLAGATDTSRIASEGSEAWSRITIYTGTTSQLPDPTYEAAVGAANAPAYRGRSAVFIESLQLDSSGQIPNLTFEVATAINPSATITRRTTNTASGVTFDITGTTGVGQPCLLALRPNIRVGVMPSTGGMSSAVYTFGLDGALQNTGTRNSDEVYPGKSGTPTGNAPELNYPVGIIDGQPVRVLNQGYPIGTTGKPILVVGMMDYNSASTGFDLTTLLPSGEYIGGHAMCSDGTHAVVFTAPTSAFFGGAVVNKWYLISYSGGVGAVLRSGTLETNVIIAVFGWGNVSTRTNNCMLEDDLQHVWTTGYNLGSTQYGGVGMFRLDPDNIMRLRGTVNGNTTAPVIPGIWAEAGFAVVAQGSQICTVRRSGDAIVTVPLATAISALCARAGLGSTQVDTSALVSSPKVVRAMAVAEVGPTRAALEQLQTAYQCEAVLSDKLYFRPRGGASVLTIPYADLGASTAGASREQPLALTIASDLEVPPQVAVQYLNDLADQRAATEVSDRLIAGQVAISTIPLGLSMQPTEAKAAADAIMADQLASLLTTALRLTLQYANLEPSDVVQVVDASNTVHRLRLVKRHDAQGVLAFDAVADDAQAIVSPGTTSAAYTAASTVTALAVTNLYPLDIPILRDTDDTPGYYVAVNGTTTNWPGCVVMTSTDGTTYTRAAQVDESAVLGTCTTTLGNWAGGSVMDELNTVTVTLADGQLSSVSRDTLLATADANAILIGSEVIRFVTATLVSTNPNVYTLSRLLRGQRGTDWASTGHAASERAVLLRTQGLRRVAQQATDINRTRYLKGVTLGRSLATATAQSFYNTGVSGMPLAPVDVRATRAFNGDVTLTWKRRTRYACNFTGPGGISVPLDQASELYDIEFYSTSAFDALSLKLTATDVAGPQYLLSFFSQFQINNRVTPVTLYCVVYQKSGARRGYGKRATVGVADAPGATTSPLVVAASASGYIVQNGAHLLGSENDYTSMWLASSPTGPYTAAYTTKQSVLGWFGTTASWVAKNNTLCIAFQPSVQINYSQRNKTVFSLARLDLSSAPGFIETSPYLTYPRAIAGDGSRFLLLGEGNHVFASVDGYVWTDLGLMSGAAFPYVIGSDDDSSPRLLKVGTRWFLILSNLYSPSAINVLFYTDNADALSGWTAATGIDVDSTTNIVNNIVFDGTYHYAVKNSRSANNGLYRSADGGASWTLEYTAATLGGFTLQCTGTTGADKVRVYGQGTTHEKLVGTTTWSSFANGLVSPAFAVEYAGQLLVTDYSLGYTPFSRIVSESGGVFTNVSGF